MTAQVKNEFNTLISDDNEYTLTELKKMLGEIYKTVKTGLKDGDKPKKKPKTEKVEKVEKKKAEPVLDDEGNPIPKKRGRPSKVRLDKDGNVKEKKPPSPYNIFVKANYAPLKEKNPDATAPEIMKMAAALWKEGAAQREIEKKDKKAAATAFINDSDDADVDE